MVRGSPEKALGPQKLSRKRLRAYVTSLAAQGHDADGIVESLEALGYVPPVLSTVARLLNALSG